MAHVSMNGIMVELEMLYSVQDVLTGRTLREERGLSGLRLSVKDAHVM